MSTDEEMMLPGEFCTTSRCHDHKLYRATFVPKRTDDLLHDTRPHIGKKTFYWTLAWIIESEPYSGQAAMMIQPIKGVQESIPMGWVPECDLADIEKVVWPQPRTRRRCRQIPSLLVSTGTPTSSHTTGPDGRRTYACADWGGFERMYLPSDGAHDHHVSS